LTVLTAVQGAPVLVVQADAAKARQLREPLASAGYNVLGAESGKDALELICAQPPACVLVGENLSSPASLALLSELRSDSVYGHLPIIAVIGEDTLLDAIDWNAVPADDFLSAPFAEPELLARVGLAIARTRRDRHANPLTGLPGNPAIMSEVDRRLRAARPFAFAYVDLDHFKAFNDRYGFARGDEVIRMTGRLLVNTVRAADPADCYVGHVGGDDFVFLVRPDRAVEVCDRFLHDFEQIIPNFYDEPDRMRGAIESIDRQGNPQRFPLMHCSIAVVDTAVTPIQHIGDLCSRAAEVKSFVKKIPGSNYFIDRRTEKHGLEARTHQS
jgi:PleD family two-component response regulator